MEFMSTNYSYFCAAQGLDPGMGVVDFKQQYTAGGCLGCIYHCSQLFMIIILDLLCRCKPVYTSPPRVTRSLRPSFSTFAYCKQPRTGGGGGQGKCLQPTNKNGITLQSCMEQTMVAR